MRRFSFLLTACTVLLVIPLFIAPSQAQMPPSESEIEDILTDLVNTVRLSSITAAYVNLGTSRDARASSLDIDGQSGQGLFRTDDPRKVKIKRLYANLFKPFGEYGKEFRLGVFVSKVKTREDFIIQQLQNYTGEIRTQAMSLGFDLALKIPLGKSRLFIQPGLGFSYSRFKMRHDYVGEFGEEVLKPVADGVFFNWNSNVLSYRGLVSMLYELPLANGLLFKMEATYLHSLIKSTGSNAPTNKLSSNFDTLFTRLRLEGPTGWILFKRPLGWRATLSNTAFVGAGDDVIGFNWFNRYDADLVWNYTGAIRVLDEVTLGVGYLNGNGVEGFSIGIGVRLKI